MKRRNFLRNIGLAGAASPFMLNSIPMKAFATPSLANSLDCTSLRERVLVIVQLFGGNDGINTLVPIDQYSTYSSLRPNIAIPETGTGAYINLDTSLGLTDQVGLNPNMSEFKSMYDNGLLSVIQGVGYENHNRSHFKSTDLVMTGGDGTFANYSFDTGWMGRYLDHSFPGLAGYSSPVMPDPLGIQLGNSESSLGFHIKGEFGTSINLSGQDLAGYYTLVSAIGGAPLANVPLSQYGQELAYAMAVEQSASNYSSRITSVFNNGSNALSYPNYGLANQLKTVARLISGGSKTKIFLVYKTGFDTHGNQLNRHTSLLTELSKSMKAFQDDLAALGIEDRVLTLTMSEFGRKAFENGNGGTDHGTLNSMFVMGSALKGGVYGTNLDLSVLDDGAPLNRQHDYRQVLTTLLQDWLGADDAALTATKFEAFANQKLDLIDASQVADSTITCPVIDQNIGETGRLTSILQNNSNTWHTVNLKRFYANPVVIMGTPSWHGNQPITVRVRNVGSHSFEWQVDEWDYLDGYHIALNIDYMVLEAGEYELENGKKLIAGVMIDSVNHAWHSHTFANSFPNAPAVFAQIVSANESSAVCTRLRGISGGGFQVRVQEEEGADLSHLPESVAWVAIERGAITIANNTITGSAGLSPQTVTEQNYVIDFGTTYAQKPLFFAAIQTHNGNNPGTLRYSGLQKSQVTINIQEETSLDAEVRHPRKEKVAHLVFESEGFISGTRIEDSGAREDGTADDANPENAFRINCYPNPFVNNFTIEPIHTNADRIMVEVTDIQGRRVYHQYDLPGQQTVKVSASHFAKGMYLVRVVAEDHVATFKMIKK
ncbi:MAG: DUF1501 domain-containing protein [Bacteroidota bacterium]